MNKRAIVPFLVKVLPVLVLATLIIRDQTFKLSFAQVAAGASEAEVIHLLGKPYAVVASAEFGGKPPEGCTKEYSYISAASFWDAFEVSFDANDRVIRKLRYRSP